MLWREAILSPGLTVGNFIKMSHLTIKPGTILHSTNFTKITVRTVAYDV